MFWRLLFPTMLGMFFSSVFVVVDGMMVGRGVGVDGLAAVNLISPLFTLSTGIGLMFGTGGSVQASVSLSKGKIGEANRYMMQAFLLAVAVALVVGGLLTLFPQAVARLFATPPELMPYALEYLITLAPAIFFNVVLTVGLFFIRLDGAPNFAMFCIASSALGNIVLDYLFIFVFGWGLYGAALATVISQLVACLMIVIYFVSFGKALRLHVMRQKWSVVIRGIERLMKKTAWKTTALGFSAFQGDLAISLMVIMGNLTFVYYLGVNGVAAFSVVCFLFPIVFMTFNAIVQSVQPIISYNMNGDSVRSEQAVWLAMKVAALLGVLFTVVTWGLRKPIVALFLSPATEAFEIAIGGIQWFGVGFFFFGLNIVIVGYLQSIGQATQATSFSVLRGVVLMLLGFILLPLWLGNMGIWLAVPIAELLTLIIIFWYHKKREQTVGRIDAVGYRIK